MISYIWLITFNIILLYVYYMCVFGVICLTEMQPKTWTELRAPYSHREQARPPHLACSKLVSRHTVILQSSTDKDSVLLFDTRQLQKFKFSTIIT